MTKIRDYREAPRPNHTDFMDSSELKKMKFNGVRHNSLSNDIEMWIEGEVKFFVTEAERAVNPNCFEQKYQEFFGLKHVEILK